MRRFTVGSRQHAQRSRGQGQARPAQSRGGSPPCGPRDHCLMGGECLGSCEHDGPWLPASAWTTPVCGGARKGGS